MDEDTGPLVLRCFYCKGAFDGDPRKKIPPGSPCEMCGESPLMFEIVGDSLSPGARAMAGTLPHH